MRTNQQVFLDFETTVIKPDTKNIYFVGQKKKKNLKEYLPPLPCAGLNHSNGEIMLP